MTATCGSCHGCPQPLTRQPSMPALARQPLPRLPDLIRTPSFLPAVKTFPQQQPLARLPQLPGPIARRPVATPIAQIPTVLVPLARPTLPPMLTSLRPPVLPPILSQNPTTPIVSSPLPENPAYLVRSPRSPEPITQNPQRTRSDSSKDLRSWLRADQAPQLPTVEGKAIQLQPGLEAPNEPDPQAIGRLEQERLPSARLTVSPEEINEAPALPPLSETAGPSLALQPVLNGEESAITPVAEPSSMLAQLLQPPSLPPLSELE